MMDRCFNCEREGGEFYGYVICDSCKKNLRLYSDKTMDKYIAKFTKSGFRKGIEERLDSLDKEYIKKKIKFLNMLDKLQ